MYGKTAPKAYHANQVSTVSKQKLIILMYDGAIRFITQAKEMTKRGDIAGRGHYIGKAQKIVDELNGALDSKRGGEVASSLSQVYIEIRKLLTDANISGNIASMDSALEMLTDIRSAWDQVISASGGAEKKTVPDVSNDNGNRLTISC